MRPVRRKVSRRRSKGGYETSDRVKSHDQRHPSAPYPWISLRDQVTVGNGLDFMSDTLIFTVLIVIWQIPCLP